MRVLIIKTSSLGDVIHTLPALTDAKKNIPDISFDWVVEPAFSEIPSFHPAVKKVIKSPIRRWRKNIIQTLKNGEFKEFLKILREEKYDFVIDAQGLIKSGLITFLSRGEKCGYDGNSAWEPLACIAYSKKFAVNPDQHAIARIRQLFAKSLNYAFADDVPDYGLSFDSSVKKNYCVFLHGTTRDDKFWPEDHWKKLIELLKDKNIKIYLPWGNDSEKERAERLAKDEHNVEVLPKSNLTELATLLAHAKFNVAVDTGLGHLSAALNAPTISLYGPTDPKLIGAIGRNQIHLKRNSLAEIMPEDVFQASLSP